MHVVIVTGLSGSGKSVAIRMLEDIGYYCVDNLPARFLADVCAHLGAAGHRHLAVSIDARSEATIGDLPGIIGSVRSSGHDVKVLFLTAATDALVQRFSETRRGHPMTQRLAKAHAGGEPTLVEAIEAERALLEPLNSAAHLIDTSHLPPNRLRQWVREFAGSPPGALTLAFESFAFKDGIPVAADLVFDVRNLPNPFYDPALRPLTGLEAPVTAFLASVPAVGGMIDDIAGFLARWLPSYVADNRHYVTVAIGCTGGQHRSPYVVEQLARRFGAEQQVLVRHRAIGKPA